MLAEANSEDVSGPAGPRPWLSIVGIGEDGLDGLTHAARQALAQAELVVGGRRHLALVGPLGAESLAWASPIENTIPAILARRPHPVCVLASGDPFCYGVGSVLARHVPVSEMASYPQPSAFSLAAARLGWAQQDCALVSLCGRPLESLLPSLDSGARVLVLSADATTPGVVADLLCARGLGSSRLTILEAMGGPAERRRHALAKDFRVDDIHSLNTIAIEVAGNAQVHVSLVPGRPDGWFEHDGQITKSEIRAATLARLVPGRGQLLWDIGAGSGSVAIEWMLVHSANRSIAVERDRGRAARIRRNATTFGVSDLQIIEGTAPAACAGLPCPDAIFIGGGATVPGVVDRCLAAVSPGGRVVINAVTIETQALLIDLFRRHGGSLSVLQVAQAEAVGGFHGWRPALPVTQWGWSKP